MQSDDKSFNHRSEVLKNYVSLAKKVVDPSISPHFWENIRFIFTYPAIAVRD